MARYAILSDVHGNLEALQAVLADARSQGVDKIICLGDTVGYGPNPKECLEEVMSSCDIVLKGNHDKYVASNDPRRYGGLSFLARLSLLWTEAQIPEQRAALAGLPARANVDGEFYAAHDWVLNPGDGTYMLFHPENEYTLSCYLALMSEGVPIGFFGHTHSPSLYLLTEKPEETEETGIELAERILKSEVIPVPQGKRIIEPNQQALSNVGSVGQQRKPREDSVDISNFAIDTRASYAIYDTETHEIDYRRVDYDIQATVAKIRKAAIDDFIRSECPDLVPYMDLAVWDMRSNFGMEESISGMLAWRLLNAE